MTASISIDILAIFALCFTIFLVQRNIVVNHQKNKIYIWAAMTVIVLLILEIATIFLQKSPASGLVVVHRLVNMAGFSLCPVVPFILLSLNSQKEVDGRGSVLRALPLAVNGLLCVASYWNGWVFYVDGQNHYSRGELFILPLVFSIFYFSWLILAIWANDREYEIDDKMMLIPLLLMPVPGIILQILLRDVLLIWGSVAVSLLLYYIFLRELQFKYDVQTGAKNRLAFEKEMTRYLKGDKNTAIVVADINNLKSTNDRLGHKAGDAIILRAAEMIRESFRGIGKVFRIGGDEFCILCPDATRETVDGALHRLDQLMAANNGLAQLEIVLAYGYAFHRKDQAESINAAFYQADAAMYQQKALQKRVGA